MNDTEAARAWETAVQEGRVNGKFRCPRCGMRANTQAESRDCCAALELLPEVKPSRIPARDHVRRAAS